MRRQGNGKIYQQKIFRVPANFVFAERLPNDVRQESHEAGTLYGLSKCALVYGREARAAARHDFAVRIDEFF